MAVAGLRGGRVCRVRSGVGSASPATGSNGGTGTPWSLQAFSRRLIRSCKTLMYLDEIRQYVCKGHQIQIGTIVKSTNASLLAVRAFSRM